MWAAGFIASVLSCWNMAMRAFNLEMWEKYATQGTEKQDYAHHKHTIHKVRVLWRGS